MDLIIIRLASLILTTFNYLISSFEHYHPGEVNDLVSHDSQIHLVILTIMSILLMLVPFTGMGNGVTIPTRTEVNDIPLALNNSIEVDMVEDLLSWINLSHHFTDPENDTLSYHVTYDKHVQGVIDQKNSTIVLVPDLNWSGDDHLIIEARDNITHHEDWNTLRINVSVEQVNDPPSIVMINDQPLEEDGPFNVTTIQGALLVITVGAADPDEIYGDCISYESNFLEVVDDDLVPVGDYVFESTTGRMEIFASKALLGEHLFEISVRDLQGASSIVTIRLIIENIHFFRLEKPVILYPLDGETIYQDPGEIIEFGADQAYDPDLEVHGTDYKITYEWDFGDGTDPMTNAGRNVHHSYLVSGYYIVKLTHRDSFGASRQTEITILVILSNYKPGDVNIFGRLLDDEDEPMIGAKIYVNGILAGMTNDEGSFDLKMNKGNSTIRFKHDGVISEFLKVEIRLEYDQDMGDIVFTLPKEQEKTSLKNHTGLVILISITICLVLLMILGLIFKRRGHENEE